MRTYKILAFLAVMVLAFSACETEVEEPAGQINVGIVPAITNLNPAAFDVNEPESTFIKFDLDAEPGVDEVAVVASYNGDLRRVNLKSYNAFPAENLKISMKEVAAALGIGLNDIQPGDVFNLEFLTLQGENTYRSNAVINAAAVCAYDIDNVTGAYRAVSEDWDADGPVTITADADDEYTLYVSGLPELDGYVGDVAPLKMTVDPLNFKVTAAKTVLSSDFSGYTNMAYEGFGLLNTCDGTYQMNFTITVDQGSFGTNAFTFIKVDAPSK